MRSFAIIFLAFLSTVAAFSGPAIPNRAATTSKLFQSRISAPAPQPVAVIEVVEEPAEENAEVVLSKNNYLSTLPTNSILRNDGATPLTNKYLEVINEPTVVRIQQASSSIANRNNDTNKKPSIWNFFVRFLQSSIRRLSRRQNNDDKYTLALSPA